MTINTRLKIAALAPILMALVISLALFFSFNVVEEAQETDRMAQRIIYRMNELNNVARSYMLYHEERQRQQFLFEHDAVTRLIAAVRFGNPEQQQLLSGISRNSEAMKAAFLELASNHTRRGPAEAEERLAGQLHTRAQEVLSDAFRLESLVDEEITATQKRINTLVFLVILVITVPLTIVLFRMMKSISASLATLRKGTESIGAGKLDHRIGMAEPDEIGDLAGAFDRMAAHLQRVTVSKEELQREVEDRKRTEKLLSENEARLNRSQEIAHLGSWELDLVNNVLTWSDEVYRIFGLQPREFGATYEAFLEAVHPEDRDAVNEAYSGSLREGRDIYEIEHRVVRKATGEIRYVHEKCQHFRDADGRIILSVGMVHDITETKKTEEEIRTLYRELQHQVRQLEESNKELEAFSYSVSHDLRSPLRSIVGFSQALLEDYNARLDAEGRDFLNRIVAATTRMSLLIDDLLRMSRMSRRAMTREHVDLSALAKKVAGELRSTRPERAAEFIIADGLTAYGDEHLLHVMLENLFANAWKFSENTPLTVIEFGVVEPLRIAECGLWNLNSKSEIANPKSAGPKSEIVYFIRDNGAGFDMTYVDKLFNPFQRLHRDAEFPGTGIGLATVKRIISRHGGRVWIEGEEGKGTTVYFTLG